MFRIIYLFFMFAGFSAAIGSGFWWAYDFFLARMEFWAFLGSIVFSAAWLSLLFDKGPPTPYHQKLMLGMFGFAAITIIPSSAPTLGCIAFMLAVVLGFIVLIPEGEDDMDYEFE